MANPFRSRSFDVLHADLIKFRGEWSCIEVIIHHFPRQVFHIDHLGGVGPRWVDGKKPTDVLDVVGRQKT